MNTSIISRLIARCRAALFATFASVFAAGGLVAPPALAEGARDLTVEQTAIYTVQATAPAATAPSGALSVVAWVDHADNTYAVGEAVRLYVRSNKDAKPRPHATRSKHITTSAESDLSFAGT